MADRPNYVAREADLTALIEHWNAARQGPARTVLLVAPSGGGKRALVGELCRTAVLQDEDLLVWRVALNEEEDGLGTLIRLYAGLFAGLHRSPTFRGKVEMALNSQIPGKPRRIQQWYQAFIDGIKKGAPKAGDQQFQVTLPRDNPLAGLVEIATGIARKFPVIFEVQSPQNCHSVGLHALLEALLVASKDTRMLTILGVEPKDEIALRAWPMPFLDLLERRKDQVVALEMAPWGPTEVGLYLESKGWNGDAAGIARIVDGLPGYVAELCEHLKATGRLDDRLDGLELAALADIRPDPEELEEEKADSEEHAESEEADAEEATPDEPKATPAEADGATAQPKQKKTKKSKARHAGVDDAERIAYLAALLGITFPSGLVAEIGGYDKDSVDDLVDATPAVYKEMQFSQPLSTWVYRFDQALLRRSVLARHSGDEDRKLALHVGAFLERFLVPRGYSYVVKTIRLYAENGEAGRAGVLRSVAITADRPDMWAMAHDLVRSQTAIEWPAPMRRTVWMNLLDRMVQEGNPEQAGALYDEALKWASETGDRPMQAWLLFAGSRLDYRRQDLYRARDRAGDALKMYQALGDKLHAGEVYGHIAMIDLADGKLDDAIASAAKAEETSDVPPVKAHSEFVRGLVDKRNKVFAKAADHFQRSNEIAGRIGQAPLALEAGLHMGECLFLAGQHARAADVLARVADIARSLQNPSRERAAAALLSQSQGALKNWEAALRFATRTLELTRSLKFERFIPIDLYNMGFFSLMLGRANEAVDLLKQARTAAGQKSDPMFQKELLFNLGTALAQIGEKGAAEEALGAALPHAEQTKDWRKVVATSERLADLALENSDKAKAVSLVERALHAAEEAELREERKSLKKRLEALKG